MEVLGDKHLCENAEAVVILFTSGSSNVGHHAGDLKRELARHFLVH